MTEPTKQWPLHNVEDEFTPESDEHVLCKRCNEPVAPGSQFCGASCYRAWALRPGRRFEPKGPT